MILMKKSPSERPNPKLREEKPHKDEGNKSWLVRHEATEGVILLGGALIPDFRIRVAQSELRHDMSPSHWSLCGIGHIEPSSEAIRDSQIQCNSHLPY